MAVPDELSTLAVSMGMEKKKFPFYPAQRAEKMTEHYITIDGSHQGSHEAKLRKRSRKVSS